MATVLVTGAAGYIGSHCCIALHEAGHQVVGVDNFANSTMTQIHRVENLIGSMSFFEGDVRDPDSLNTAFDSHQIDAVMHFAGLKSVADSVAHPSDYFTTNVYGTLGLLTAMNRHAIDRLVFSSSCTIYGDPDEPDQPVNELTPAAPMNPYGLSKLRAEQLIEDLTNVGVLASAVSLRYFNPIGAHESGTLGESPKQVPTNLVPVVLDSITGKRSTVEVFGVDYPTRDGTCIRDYLHVVDLVNAHVNALHFIDKNPGYSVFNLGTGRGTTVFEVIEAIEKVTGEVVPYQVAARRDGDAAALFADASLAEKHLGWRATRTLLEMCEDHWVASLRQAEPQIIDVRQSPIISERDSPPRRDNASKRDLDSPKQEQDA